MNRNARRFFLTALIAGAGALLSAAFGPAFAQSNAPEASRGAPQDWSHKHLLYTNPDTRDEAARKGTLAFEQWKQKNKDPRFAAQVARKTHFAQASNDSPFTPEQLRWANRFNRNQPPAGPAVHRDWSNVLGGVSGAGKANVFPAKYQFDISANPDCANDFVVYTTTAAGATSSGVGASRTGTVTTNPTSGTVTITHTGSPALVLTATPASGGSNLGFNFQIGSTTTITATNLAAAIARNGGTAGVTATSATNVVTVTSLTTGATANVTLASALTGFAWAGTTLTGGSGTAGQPTIIAFNQLYSSCGTTPTQAVPATFWSYNTGTGAVAQSSPVLSLDGKQVAFIQGTGTGGTAASLVLLKWSSSSPGTVGAPTPPASVTAANYLSCTAPCMTIIPFNGSPANTNSSPYYDYIGDVIYVGANDGKLHKFINVFNNSTPTEVVSTGVSVWPAVVTTTATILTSPVYDSVSGLVFVGSGTGTNGARLHSVHATNGSGSGGAVVSTALLGTTASLGLVDSPIVDNTTGKVYAFVGRDNNTANTMSVYQFPTALPTGTPTSYSVHVGTGSSNTALLYGGTFDNVYYSGTGLSGNLYVCGSASATNRRPTMWKIPITNTGAMGAPVAGPTLVTGAADCSPVAEIFNGTNDYIYASVTTLNKTGAGWCSGATTTGCVFMLNLNSIVTWGTAITATAGLPASGGASGIIMDNISTVTGASQIYYSTVTSPGNAVQASQGALQ